MWRQSRVMCGVTLGLLSLGIAACGGSSGGSGGSGEGGTTSLKIGDVVPLTGPAAVFGPSWDKAANLAVADANAAAKAAGVKLHVTISAGDEGASPQTAVDATRQLVSQGATCVLGGLSSSDSIAMAKGVTIPRQIVQISPASSSVLYGKLHDNGGFTFRTLPSDALQSQLLADYMAQSLGGAQGKLVSVAARNDSYGSPAAQAFVAAWRKLGGSTEGPVLYDPNATSYDSEAAKIVASKPAAFVIFDDPGTYAKVGAALLRTGGFDATKLYSTSGFPSKIPNGLPAAALEGAHFVNAGLPQSGPALKSYQTKYDASPLKPSAAQPYNENNFDAAMLCILAAAAAHSSEGRAMADKIPSIVSPAATSYTYEELPQAFSAIKAGKSINYSGLSGSTQLDAHGDPTSTLASVSEYRKGALVPLSQVQLTDGKLTTK